MPTTVPTPCDIRPGTGRYGAGMAEPTEATDAGPPAKATTPRVRGTTSLSRVSAALAWFVGVWFLFYGFLYVPLLVLGALVIWLAVGAWRGRRRPTIGLAVLGAAAAIYYPAAAWWRWNHRRGDFAEFSYPRLWIAMLAIQSALLLAIAITAMLSLRRPAATPDAEPTNRR